MYFRDPEISNQSSTSKKPSKMNSMDNKSGIPSVVPGDSPPSTSRSGVKELYEDYRNAFVDLLMLHSTGRTRGAH